MRSQFPKCGEKDARERFEEADACDVSGAESGFTLIETMFALVIILIALLGVAHSFTYAILYNMGNATRTQCVAILQQQVEQLRAKKWTTNGVDAALASGQTVQHIPSNNGGQFSVTITVDDDPFTDGVQADTTSNLKEITVVVKLDAPSPGGRPRSRPRL